MVNPGQRDEAASECLEESQQSTLRLVLIPTQSDASHGKLLCSAWLSFKSKRVRQPCRELNFESCVLCAPSAVYTIDQPSPRGTGSSWIIADASATLAAKSCIIHRSVWTPYGIGYAIRDGGTGHQGDVHKRRPTADKRAYTFLYNYLSINAD